MTKRIVKIVDLLPQIVGHPDYDDISKAEYCELLTSEELVAVYAEAEEVIPPWVIGLPWVEWEGTSYFMLPHPFTISTF